jgi:L-asparaginase
VKNNDGVKIMTIKIFITGGTFDKEYDEIEGKLFFKDTRLQKILELGRCSLDIEIETLMMKDSLDMTENDRNIILDRCKKTKQGKIVVTHGTDTMEVTGRILANSIDDKTIVLTGAMIPIRFGSSDGLFNLGSSLAFVQTLPHGVYISMNGRYFHWNNVRKSKCTGTFVTLTDTINNKSEKHSITIDNSNVEKFIITAKRFVGLDACDKLSLEDIYSIASNFDLNGIIYLEKFDDKGHVNVLININKDFITLYDPLSGIKIKPYNETHFGMYCKPVGSFRDEFQRYEQQFAFDEPGDVWDKYKRKGKLLYEFLMQSKDFNSFYSESVSSKVNFPTLQNNIPSSDCAPISLFIISLCNSLHLKS